MDEPKSLFQKIKGYVSLSTFKISKERRREMYSKAAIILVFIYFKYLFIEYENHANWFVIIIDIVLIYFLISILVHYVRIIFMSIYRRRNKFEIDHSDNFTLGITKLATLLTWLLFAITLFSYFVDDPVKFVTTLGLFSVALAWLFKEKFANLIDGLDIMFSNDLRLKDYIVVGDYHGRVVSINFSNTQLQTDDGDIAYVPNTKLQNSEFLNYSKGNVKRIRYDFSLSSNFFGKIDKLEKSLSKAILKEYNDLVDEESVILKVSSIDSEHAALTLELRVTRYNFSIDNMVKKFVSRQILKFLYRESKKKK